MTSSEIQAAINKAKAQLDAAQEKDEIAFAKKKIAKLEAQLDEAKGMEDKEAEAKKKPKPKNAIKVTAENLPDCDELLAKQKERREKAEEWRKENKPTNGRKVTVVAADSLVRIISGAVNKKIKAGKAKELKTDALKEAVDYGKKMLAKLREGLGGIGDENSGMVQRFTSEINGIFKEIEDSVNS